MGLDRAAAGPSNVSANTSGTLAFTLFQSMRAKHDCTSRYLVFHKIFVRQELYLKV
ncbi:protein of unknown function [Pararobbsia alpina]